MRKDSIWYERSDLLSKHCEFATKPFCLKGLMAWCIGKTTGLDAFLNMNSSFYIEISGE